MSYDRVFARAVVVRSVLVWAVLRALAAVGQQMHVLPSDGGPMDLHPVALVFLYGAVVAAVLLDARRVREDQFLANLGISRWGTASLVILTVAVCEAGLWLVLRPTGS